MFAATLMEHLAVAAFVLDASGRVLIWNRACERLTGLPAAEMIGARDHWKALYHEERPCLADLLLQGRLNEAGELYEVWSDTEVNPGGLSTENWCVMPRLGRRCYLAIDVGPIYDESGKIIAVVEILRDLTAHKRIATELEELAGRDDLTSLANRRTFDVRLADECRRSTRGAGPLSLLMIDVDYFKQYNDANGHLAGDEALQTVAKCVQSQALRAGDVAARIGGEEFAVILPQTPMEGAVAVAERLRAVVERTQTLHGGSPVSPYVTVSIGAMTSVEACPTPAELLQKADMALYEAKRGGRNRALHYAACAPQLSLRIAGGRA